MPTAEFEPAIPASERPQTNALDRAATKTCTSWFTVQAGTQQHSWSFIGTTIYCGRWTANL